MGPSETVANLEALHEGTELSLLNEGRRGF